MATETSPVRSRGRRMLRTRVVALVIATLAAVGGLVLPAATASAGTTTCSSAPSDNNCTGHWPDIDACTPDATTVATASINGNTLELRWSPHCQSNWARVTLGGNNAQVWVERSDGNHQYSSWNYVSGQEWSPMVYAPVLKARACVTYKDWLNTISGCTNWV